MTFKAEFSFDSIEELQAFIASTSPVAPAVAPSLTIPVVADKKDAKSAKVTKGPQPEPVAEAAKPSGLPFIGKKAPPVAEKVEETAPVKEKEKKLTYDYVSRATLDAVKATSRDKVKEILTTFGVSKAPDLAEDQWPDYIKRCGDLMKSATAKKAEPEVEEELA